MKAHLLYPDRDFDLEAGPPPASDDLIQDLELSTLLRTMAAGDSFLLDISTRVLLAGLTEPDGIRYRQQVLADCMAEPEVIRAMYDITVAALHDKRRAWGFFSSQYPTSILSGAINQLEVLIVRLRELRQIADEHAAKFRSLGLTALLQTLQLELDDEYFETLNHHLRELRFRSGELMSARLDRDNSGIDYFRVAADQIRSHRDNLGPVNKHVCISKVAKRSVKGQHSSALQ